VPDGVRLPGVGVVAQELRTAAPPMLASFWGVRQTFHFSAKQH